MTYCGSDCCKECSSLGECGGWSNLISVIYYTVAIVVYDDFDYMVYFDFLIWRDLIMKMEYEISFFDALVITLKNTNMIIIDKVIK